MSKRYFEISVLIPDSEPIADLRQTLEPILGFGGKVERETTDVRAHEWVANKERERLVAELLRHIKLAANSTRPRAQITTDLLKRLLVALGGMQR